MKAYVLIFLASLLSCVAITPVVKGIAWSCGAVDYPSARRINDRPTPRLGGVGVFLSFLVGIIVYVLLFATPGDKQELSRHINVALLALSFVVVFMTGVVDDIWQLSPMAKLAGLVAAAVLATLSGADIEGIVKPFTGDTELISFGWCSLPITVLYLVSYANIINLIDGLDGLASGIAFLASVTMAIVAARSSIQLAVVFPVALAGSCLGFLKYNFHPASVFLGDSGSLFIGFALGTCSLLNVNRTAGLTTIIVPLVVAGVPILDTFSAIVRRVRAHVSIGHADKGHLHHRLLKEGLDQRQTALAVYLWTGILCLGALLMTQVETIGRMIIFGTLLLCSMLVVKRLHLLEPVLLHHYNPDTGEDEIVEAGTSEFEQEQRLRSPQVSR